jgi:hypothetical protein
MTEVIQVCIIFILPISLKYVALSKKVTALRGDKASYAVIGLTRLSCAPVLYECKIGIPV